MFWFGKSVGVCGMKKIKDQTRYGWVVGEAMCGWIKIR